MSKLSDLQTIPVDAAERLLDLFEPVAVLAGVANNLAQGEHYEAAKQVIGQLSEKVAWFKSLLHAPASPTLELAVPSISHPKPEDPSEEPVEAEEELT